MYIDPELRDRVYQLFSLEVTKMLQTIETELVTLSIDRSADKVNSLMRAAHSIKGGAASLGLDAIAELAHQIEDIFRVLSHPDLPFDANLDRLLFQIYDCLNQLITAEINNESLDAGFYTSIQIILADLDEEIGHFVIAGQKLPADLLCSGFDLTQSIFEVDVAQSLTRLERVLLDPDCMAIAVGEFRAQAEVFTGIAALTNLPEFGKLAHATISAFDRHPDRAREMCCFALVDFYRALEDVLTGDRSGCGQISPGFAFAIAEPPRSLVGGELFEPLDLEALFNDLVPVEALDRPDDAPDLFDWMSASHSLEAIPELTSVDLAVSPLAHSYFWAGMDELEVDFIIEDLLSSPAQVDGAIDFDLVDLFDLPSSAALTIFSPTADRLDFDLVELFDLPSAAPVVTPTLDLDRIGTTISELRQNFESLLPITPATFASPLKSSEPIRVKKSHQKNQQQPAIPQLSVRVGLDRLERMNNLMGEIAIERHGLALSTEQSTDTLDRLRSKCTNFQAISDRLRQIADTLAITSQRPLVGDVVPAQSPLDPALDRQFDVLELDRYSEVHHIAQDTIEQLAQIEEQIEDLSLFVAQSHRQIDRQKQLLSHLRDDLMWARMLPLGEILNRFPRTLHDLSVEFNKPADLKITGAGVLVDRSAIDKLLDPLLHLLRNAFDHGIDSPATRLAMGKPERGQISICAYHQGSQTIIEIADDGCGIDLDAIKAKAIAMNLLDPSAAETISRNRLFDFLFEPGFSTADRVTKLSGRGMGLDIVKAQIQSIKGTISIDSEWGRGTTFTLNIPLTLTIAQLIVCQVGNAVYAFPADSIQKIVVPTVDRLSQPEDRQLFHWQNLSIPIYNIKDLLDYSIPVPERSISHTLKSSANNPADWLPPLLLIRRADRLVALQIDRLITEQELTIVPFGKAITPPSYSYGCTILGDGLILPVLNPHTLITVLIDRSSCPLLPPQPLVSIPPARITTVLAIDDSITTRQSLCLSLEKFGYRTLQAKDGQEALQILRQKASEIQLVVCDVEMPNMNGFEFLNVYRQEREISHIPVVMLTSRSNAKHRQFAAYLGAIDYFIKPYVEEDFMNAIGKIIDNRSKLIPN
jgi:two-component system, chemotaxis family, sensor histidine kinase and response regulator PixL